MNIQLWQIVVNSLVENLLTDIIRFLLITYHHYYYTRLTASSLGQPG